MQSNGSQCSAVFLKISERLTAPKQTPVTFQHPLPPTQKRQKPVSNRRFPNTFHFKRESAKKVPPPGKIFLSARGCGLHLMWSPQHPVASIMPSRPHASLDVPARCSAWSWDAASGAGASTLLCGPFQASVSPAHGPDAARFSSPCAQFSLSFSSYLTHASLRPAPTSLATRFGTSPAERGTRCLRAVVFLRDTAGSLG